MGVFSGAIGVIVKPVTGVLDALVKTSDGLRCLALGHEDRANTQRIRIPRVFYGGNSVIKAYNNIDCQMYQAL